MLINPEDRTAQINWNGFLSVLSRNPAGVLALLAASAQVVGPLHNRASSRRYLAVNSNRLVSNRRQVRFDRSEPIGAE
jgi:hypothetical protein